MRNSFFGEGRAALAGLAALSVLLLAGCGGGGGGSNTGGFGGGGFGNTGGNGNSGGNGNTGGNPAPGASSVVLGKVVDTDGNVVPGATVIPDGGGVIANTLSQGGYRLEGLTPGVHRLVAGVTIKKVSYTGSTQVLALQNATVSNADMVLSLANQQASVTGTVRDTSGRPIPGVRVFVGVLVGSGVTSLVAFTDNNGVYLLQNVPTVQGGNAGISYTIAASATGYQNQKFSQGLVNLQPGETRGQDFVLAGSSNQAVNAPTNLFVQAFTQPSTPQLAPQVARAHAAAGSVYEQIRRSISPNYARLAQSRHGAAKTRPLVARAHVSADSPAIIEMDVSFSNTNQPDSLAGFTIYNTALSSSLAPYDFLQDPLANFYSDLDPIYNPNQVYNFAVSATNTQGTESALSSTVTIAPLGLLRLTQPQPDDVLSNPVTIAWSSVYAATGYAVFVYDQFPTINTQPVFTSQQATAGGALLPAGTTSYKLPIALTSGQDYFVVVAASATLPGAEDDSISAITRFRIP